MIATIAVIAAIAAKKKNFSDRSDHSDHMKPSQCFSLLSSFLFFQQFMIDTVQW